MEKDLARIKREEMLERLRAQRDKGQGQSADIELHICGRNAVDFYDEHISIHVKELNSQIGATVAQEVQQYLLKGISYQEAYAAQFGPGEALAIQDNAGIWHKVRQWQAPQPTSPDSKGTTYLESITFAGLQVFPKMPWITVPKTGDLAFSNTESGESWTTAGFNPTYIDTTFADMDIEDGATLKVKIGVVPEEIVTVEDWANALGIESFTRRTMDEYFREYRKLPLNTGLR